MTSSAVQLQEDATGWADEFGGISQGAERWADQFAEQIVPNEEVCPCCTTQPIRQVNFEPWVCLSAGISPLGEQWVTSLTRLAPVQCDFPGFAHLSKVNEISHPRACRAQHTEGKHG